MMKQQQSGFTLIETLVAISVLVIAIVAPMQLTTQSLSAAFYARDQVTAFHLAQEAIEAVRNLRDHNILQNAYGTPTDILAGIPIATPFVIDTRNNQIWTCTDTCPALKTSGSFYAYGTDPFNQTEAGWTPSRFTRTVRANWVNAENHDEVRVSVSISWQTGAYARPPFVISEDLYRWVNDGTAQ